MRAPKLIQRILPLLLALAAAQALAQADPPARVGRLNFNEGSVAFSPAGESEWVDAPANRPLLQGDRLWTDPGSRAELHAGAVAVRLDGQTHVAIVGLDDRVTRLLVPHGALQVRLRELFDGDSLQIDTPNLAFRAVQAGEYRVDVDSASGTTRVTVHSGTGMAYGENGQALPLGGGQQIVFRGRALSQAGAQEAPPQDGFDRWAGERDRREDQSIAARYVPREVTGYQQLDGNGSWSRDPALGPVWIPRDADASWAPYRNGRWESLAPWGWTWIDDAPWGFATSHYGRWALLAERWAWVPGRLPARPVYAPALVAFAASTGSPEGGALRLPSGRRGVAWFPLGPGEAWKPGFRASPVYVSNVNRNMAAGEPAGGSYVHRRPEAITAVAVDDFRPGATLRNKLQRLAAGDVARLQVAAPPAEIAAAPAPEPVKLQIARIAAPRAVASVAPAPSVAPVGQPVVARTQLTITREEVQLALQAEEKEQARREQARREEAQRVEAQRAEAQRAEAQRAEAQARLAKQKAAQRRDELQREAQRRAQREHERELALAQARQARAQLQARQQREQAKQEQARRTAQAQAQAQAIAQARAQAAAQARARAEAAAQAQADTEARSRHEAQVRRALGLANAEAQAQERRRQLQAPFTLPPPGPFPRERRS